MSSKNYHILIVDDDPEFHQQIRYSFRRQFVFDGAVGYDQLLRKLTENNTYDLILLDLVFDDSSQKSGLDIIPQIREKFSHIPVIMVTADRAIDNVVAAMKKGARDFLVKGDFDFDFWQEKFTAVIESGRLKQENEVLRAEVKRIRKKETEEFPFIGASPQIIEIKRILKLVSEEPDLTVLINGETGTGKEVAARFLHAHGARRDKAFQAINLSAIQDTLLESTLFGHKKGAFTGATRDMEGYFSQANGGILMLDEIGDIDHNIQIKLLRFLETKMIRPVGSDKDVQLDVQVVTATHRNLEQSVREGKFRADLFQRLKAMVIELPPLRNRKADIKLLLQHFFQSDHLETLIDQDALNALVAYKWVGNIRELKNTVSSMQLRARIQDKRIIDSSCLPSEILQPSTGFSAPPNPSFATSFSPATKMHTPVSSANIDEKHAIIDLDKIEELLVLKNSVKKDVAVAMGLENTDNLRYRIKKHFDKHPHLFKNFPMVSRAYRRIVKL